ncbi:hypothetical protein [Azotobacter beijerinckii]|uniref:Uncharacterized protein n=1 Tax=Azotobacter beijerinckii TaxID=170623 RepID=A0A1I4I694_9GAMM|nr:hypothetical protein [Azotobacter beijerinckii]SFL49928.1 hypothetical protein SAMN04244574_04497 [Azotobacter beijerinckii]
MNIKYKYAKANSEVSGELSIPGNDAGHHDVVKAALTEIASKEGERIVVAMMSPYVEGLQVGVNHFDPVGVEPSEQRTIESIQICEDGENWNSVVVINS